MNNIFNNSPNLLRLLDLAVDKQAVDQVLKSWSLEKSQPARYLLEHIVLSHLLISIEQMFDDNLDKQQLLALLSSKSLDSTQLTEWLSTHAEDTAPTLKQVGARVLFSLTQSV